MTAEPYIATASQTGSVTPGQIEWGFRRRDGCLQFQAEAGYWAVNEVVCQWQPYADFEREKLRELRLRGIGIRPVGFFTYDNHWNEVHCNITPEPYTSSRYEFDTESGRLLARARFLKAVCEKEGVGWVLEEPKRPHLTEGMADAARTKLEGRCGRCETDCPDCRNCDCFPHAAACRRKPDSSKCEHEYPYDPSGGIPLFHTDQCVKCGATRAIQYFHFKKFDAEEGKFPMLLGKYEAYDLDRMATKAEVERALDEMERRIDRKVSQLVGLAEKENREFRRALLDGLQDEEFANNKGFRFVYIEGLRSRFLP